MINMPSPLFENALILAAGYGTRMRPLTNAIPKPMAQINGETLIKRAIRKLRQAGIKNIAVNAHYRADQLIEHLQQDDVHIMHEDILLDTGGSVYKACQYFGMDTPLYCVSGDSWWDDDKNHNIIRTLDKAWDDSEHDIMLMLQNINAMNVTKAVGDYHYTKDTLPKRSLDQNGSHMWTSIRLLHPRIFDTMTAAQLDKPFSLLPLIDHAQNIRRLGATDMKGIWHHISTMDDLDAVTKWVKSEQS